MHTASFVSLLAVLLFGGLPGGLPLGMPPGPEDSAVARVAPDECLFYFSWAGTAAASAESPNQTEQLLAEPEVRRFLDEVQARLKDALRQGAGEGERSQVVAEEAPKLLGLALTHPAALYVEQLAPGAAGVDVRGGMAIHLEDRAAEFEKSWRAIEKALGTESTVEKDDKSGWRLLMPAPGATGVSLRWTVSDGYFLVAIGEGAHTRLLERLRDGKPPAWLTGLRTRLPVPRTANVMYLNVKPLVGMFSATLAAVDREGAARLDQLGLKQIESLAVVTGLDETGCVSRTLLKMNGRPAALLRLFDSAALEPADLGPIPADAAVGIAVRFDAARTLEAFTALAEQFERGADRQIKREFDQMSQELGFSVQDDLLPALGDTWRIYHSPGEGGSLFTNWTGVVSVRDPKKLAEIATVIEFRAREAKRLTRGGGNPRGNRQRMVSVEQTRHDGKAISFLNFVGEESPVAPAWCFTGKEVVVSTFPQGVQAYLARDAKAQSLAAVPEVSARLAQAKPIAFVHYDSAHICRAVYPLAQMFGNVALGELQREGVDLNIAMLPSLPSLVRHMRPAATTLSAADDGLEFVTHRTLPIGVGPVQTVLPLSMGVMVPIRMGRGGSPLSAFSPDAARQQQAKNHLKQIGLAMHNFHDTHGKFPAAATTDKAGKPLLSWRVQILPFIEDAALFNEFHHDEPWDSPHNKKLIERLPAIYKAPGSEADAGKTVYLTIRGEGTIFPPDRGLKISEITDGTSNTVMVVEASDKQAVTWTKPDDFPFDEKEPGKGLVGLRRGGFLVGFADGSVRFISESIAVETLRNLFLRNDGNVIGDF